MKPDRGLEATCSAVAALRRLLDPVRARVERDYQRNEDDAQAQCERQVALAGLERDGGGHDARDAIDVTANDHDRPDLRGGTAKPGQNDGNQGEARVP